MHPPTRAEDSWPNFVYGNLRPSASCENRSEMLLGEDVVQTRNGTPPVCELDYSEHRPLWDHAVRVVFGTQVFSSVVFFP